MSADTTTGSGFTRPKAASAFEGRARSVKAYRLVEGLDAVAVANGQDPFGNAETVRAMGRAIALMDEPMWRALADRQGVHPPSDKTIAEVRAIYVRRARFARQVAAQGLRGAA